MTKNLVYLKQNNFKPYVKTSVNLTFFFVFLFSFHFDQRRVKMSTTFFPYSNRKVEVIPSLAVWLLGCEIKIIHPMMIQAV